MKINTKIIEGYDGMSVEDKLKALESYEFDAVSKDTYDKVSSEAAGYKKQIRASMEESERAKVEQEERLKAAEARVAELEGREKMANYKAEFTSIGYDTKLADTAAKAMLDGDMQKVFGIQRDFLKSRESAIKAELLKDTPKPPAGDGGNGGPVTKEQFARMGYAERSKLYTENKELYDQLAGNTNE